MFISEKRAYTKLEISISWNTKQVEMVKAHETKEA